MTCLCNVAATEVEKARSTQFKISVSDNEYFGNLDKGFTYFQCSSAVAKGRWVLCWP